MDWHTTTLSFFTVEDPKKIMRFSAVTVTSKLSKSPLVAILDFGESPALRRQIKMLETLRSILRTFSFISDLLGASPNLYVLARGYP